MIKIRYAKVHLLNISGRWDLFQIANIAVRILVLDRLRNLVKGSDSCSRYLIRD